MGLYGSWFFISIGFVQLHHNIIGSEISFLRALDLVVFLLFILMVSFVRREA